jgi:tRNA modification GTPase
VFIRDDTIVAIATPLGRGGIGVVRISGPASREIAARLAEPPVALEPRRATFARVRGTGGIADQAVLTWFAAPHSYTAEDVVEISVHGSGVLLRAVLHAAMAAGARLAEPGEFTLRAYLNGRIDLVQAEAVSDLVNAVTPLQARAAFDQLEGTLTSRIREMDEALLSVSARLEASLDFPEEGYHFAEPAGIAAELKTIADAMDRLLEERHRGRLVREGAQVIIAGRPNSGKSSIFNYLLGSERAIVTDVPGTTRDMIAEVVDLEGLAITLVDTAGVRHGVLDPIESEGIARAHAAHAVADVVLLVLDRSSPLSGDDHRLLEVTSDRPRVIAANKSDLESAWDPDHLGAQATATSTVTGHGMVALRQSLAAALGAGPDRRDPPAITNVRQADLLGRAAGSLRRAADAAHAATPEEFVVTDVVEARRLLEEITGSRTPDDVLREIFSRFCIGK